MSKSYKMSVYTLVNDEDTEVRVLFTHFPAQPELADCPGQCAEIEVDEIIHNGASIKDLDVQIDLDEIESKCWEYIKNT